MSYLFKDFKLPLLAAFLLLALCFLIYGGIYSHEFLMDDYLCYFGDASLSGVSVHDLFFNGFKGIYRPLGLSFLKAQALWFGTSPMGYHLCNILLFFLICFLSFILTFRLSSRFDLSLLASVLFAVHPINNFLLNYKTAGSLTLFVLFLQLSTLCFLLFLDKSERRWLLASLGAYALALFCHEIAFILPVFLFLIMGYFSDRSFKKRVLICSFYAIPFCLYLFLRTRVPAHIQATGLMSVHLSGLSYINTLMNLLSWYLSKLVVPVRVLFTWDMRPAPDQWQLGSIGLLTVLSGLLIYGFWPRRKNRLLFALVFFLAGFLPISLASFVHTPKIGLAAIEPHWFVYPSMGFFALAAGCLLWLKNVLPYRLGLVVILSLIILLGVMTHQGNKKWQTASDFCQYWLETNALNGSAWHCLADDYIRKEDKGADPSLYQNCQEPALLGWGYHIKGKAELSYRYYAAALKTDPQCAIALYGLALLYEQVGSETESIRFLKKAKFLDPEGFSVYELLREVFLDKGHQDQYNRIKNILVTQDKNE